MSRPGAHGLATAGLMLVLIILAGSPASAIARSPYPVLSQISCGSPGDCAAVGTEYRNPGGATAVLFTESNGSWATGAQARLSADAGLHPFSYLFSVSCASAGNCTALGSYTTNSGGGQGLLLTETNGSWATGTEARLPGDATHTAGRQFVELSSVSCPSAASCTAIGTYIDGSRHGRGLLLTERNGTWATGIEARRRCCSRWAAEPVGPLQLRPQLGVVRLSR